MTTAHHRLLALVVTFILAGCDVSPVDTANSTHNTTPAFEKTVDVPQTLKLDVNESILKSLQQHPSDGHLPLSESLILKIEPVKDQQRLSVNGKLLLQETWQADYLDNIDGGKVELQLWFDD